MYNMCDHSKFGVVIENIFINGNITLAVCYAIKNQSFVSMCWNKVKPAALFPLLIKSNIETISFILIINTQFDEHLNTYKIGFLC